MSHPLHLISWKRIKEALANIYKVKSYYVGGTLCIDMPEGYCVGLNTNGRGFALSDGKEITFIVTRDVQETIRNIYREFKGREPRK